MPPPRAGTSVSSPPGQDASVSRETARAFCGRGGRVARVDTAVLVALSRAASAVTGRAGVTRCATASRSTRGCPVRSRLIERFADDHDVTRSHPHQRRVARSDAARIANVPAESSDTVSRETVAIPPCHDLGLSKPPCFDPASSLGSRPPSRKRPPRDPSRPSPDQDR